jgi:hypothetical protein
MVELEQRGIGSDGAIVRIRRDSGASADRAEDLTFQSTIALHVSRAARWVDAEPARNFVAEFSRDLANHRAIGKVGARLEVRHAPIFIRRARGTIRLKVAKHSVGG